jgi:two-component system response regulator FixJ
MDTRGKVYIVDDDEQMRRVLVRQLQADYDVTDFAAARQFLDVAAALQPGCLILDVHMPDISGLEVQRHLAERNLRFPTIIITGAGEVGIAVQAMKAGAIDFVEKPFRGQQILDSLEVARQHLSPTGGENAVAARTRLSRLSTRETEVLNGLVTGLPNKTIAYDLGLSPRTVEMHRANIMKKMDVTSLSALVRTAMAAGFLIKS